MQITFHWAFEASYRMANEAQRPHFRFEVPDRYHVIVCSSCNLSHIAAEGDAANWTAMSTKCPLHAWIHLRHHGHPGPDEFPELSPRIGSGSGNRPYAQCHRATSGGPTCGRSGRRLKCHLSPEGRHSAQFAESRDRRSSYLEHLLELGARNSSMRNFLRVGHPGLPSTMGLSASVLIAICISPSIHAKIS